MNITDRKYYNSFYDIISSEIDLLINNNDFSDEKVDLSYLTKASAVFSSNIEGNSIDLNSFMNYKLSNERFSPTKEIQEIEDLISAYEFAQASPLNEVSFLHTHKLLSSQLLISSKQGEYRTEKVGVFSALGLVYLAVEAEFVAKEMNLFFKDLEYLLSLKMTDTEVFYFASLIHLKFVHIHPFMDGNGRAARLLEKWFLAEKLGSTMWKINSEKYYKEHQAEYYKNINLGVNYYELDYEKCMPFLLMLPNCLK